MYDVTLTRDGLRYERRREDALSGEWVTDVVVARPASASELLRFWHWTFSVAEGVVFGDLMALLAGVADIELLDGLLDCDVRAFLDEAVVGALTAPSERDGAPRPPFHISRDFH